MYSTTLNNILQWNLQPTLFSYNVYRVHFRCFIENPHGTYQLPIDSILQCLLHLGFSNRVIGCIFFQVPTAIIVIDDGNSGFLQYIAGFT